MQITETALARQHMTPESRSLFRDATLDKRMGQGTIAGGLNDQIRFRFDKRGGAPSDWKLVPDNKLSADLLGSKAGAALEGRVRTMLGSFDAAHGKDLLELQGIMLSDDAQSWAAGWQLMMRDAARRSDAPMMSPMSPKEAMASATPTVNIAGAQSIYGWVQFAPEQARNMLTSIGAYTPAESEKFARSGAVASHTGPLVAHELHHRVSEADFRTNEATARYMPLAWLEEGTATLLAMRGAAQRAHQRAWDVSPQQHAGHVAAPDSFDPGWKPWHGDPKYLMGYMDTMQANYVDSVGTINSLLRLAGVDRRTTAGRERTFDLLQGDSVDEVPRQLARAILREQGVRATANRVAELSDRIVHANDQGGMARVEQYLQRVEGAAS